jgi:hypothetical protein
MTKTQRHIIDHKQQTALRPLMLFYVLVCLFVSVGSAQVISTSGSVSINNTSGTVIGTTTIETAAGADVTNNGTINLSGDWTNGGTYTSASGTVEYLGAGAQSVAGLNYHHLLLSTSGTKTLAASTAVAGNLTLSGTAAVVDNGFQITGNGSGTMTMAAGNTLTLGSAGTATLFPTNFTNGNTTLSAGSTVIYNSDQAQTISGTPTYSHLTLTATSAVTKTVDAALTVNGDLTVNANNTLNDGGFQITGNAGGTLTLAAGTTLTLGTAGSATVFPTTFITANISLNASSTVVYNSDLAQAISVVPVYGNLTLTATSSVIKTISSAATVATDLTVGTNNTLTITGAGSVLINTGNLILNGSLDNSGTIDIGL